MARTIAANKMAPTNERGTAYAAVGGGMCATERSGISDDEANEPTGAVGATDSWVDDCVSKYEGEGDMDGSYDELKAWSLATASDTGVAAYCDVVMS